MSNKFDPAKYYSSIKAIPPWLMKFSMSPEEALIDLFTGEAELGHLKLLEIGQLFGRWFEDKDFGKEFGLYLDKYLTVFVIKYWGIIIFPDTTSKPQSTSNTTHSQYLLAKKIWLEIVSLIEAYSLPLTRKVIETNIISDPGFLMVFNNYRLNSFVRKYKADNED